MHGKLASHATHAEHCLAMQEQQLMPSLSLNALKANWRLIQVSLISTNKNSAQYMAAACAHWLAAMQACCMYVQAN